MEIFILEMCIVCVWVMLCAHVCRLQRRTLVVLLCDTHLLRLKWGQLALVIFLSPPAPSTGVTSIQSYAGFLGNVMLGSELGSSCSSTKHSQWVIFLAISYRILIRISKTLLSGKIRLTHMQYTESIPTLPFSCNNMSQGYWFEVIK